MGIIFYILMTLLFSEGFAFLSGRLRTDGTDNKDDDMPPTHKPGGFFHQKLVLSQCLALVRTLRSLLKRKVRIARL